MTYTRCRDDVAGGLTKVLWVASQIDEASDFEDLLDAIRVLRPRWKGAGTVVAWRHVRRQAWMDALRVLEDDDLEAKRSALHAALMAVCLFGLEDPLWHSYARTAAEQRENVEAAKIGNRLLERAAKAGGRDASAEPAPAAAAPSHDASSFAASAMWVRA
ncbi:HrpB1 family type III secretion system apparatus protein [Paraburkholderia sp. 2C]